MPSDLKQLLRDIAERAATADHELPENALLNILFDIAHRATVGLEDSPHAAVWDSQFGLVGVARNILHHAPQEQMVCILKELADRAFDQYQAKHLDDIRPEKK